MIALAPAPIAPEPNPATAPARALIEGQIAVLTRLTNIGMEIAETAGRQAVSASGEAPAHANYSASPSLEPRPFAPAHDPGLTFARVARAVRMTIALQSRLMKDLAALDRADDLAAASRKDDRRMRLRRLTVQAAEAQVGARRDAALADDAHATRASFGDDAAHWSDDRIEAEIETLAEEAYERLTDAEDDDLGDRPFAEIVAAICGDLGLSADWTTRLLAATGAKTAPSIPPPTTDDPFTDVSSPAAPARSRSDGWRASAPDASALSPLAVTAPPPDALRLGP